MSKLSNLDLIQRIPLFSPLTAAQAESLASTVVKRRYARGEVVVQQGATSNSLFIILSGKARVVMADGKGREVILATMRSGDYFGEMSLIDNDVHSATVLADIATDVLVLGREDFSRCLAESMAMANAMMRGLVQRLRNADKKIGSLALMDVYGRVAGLLLQSALPDAQGQPTLRDMPSRQDIAKTVGASREMVSRVMKDLEESGFVEVLEGGAVRLNERRAKSR
jgi:CRP-like cAMP-binding protein